MSYNCKIKSAKPVAPYTGAWIEIPRELVCIQLLNVAPYTGAWIEMLERLRKKQKKLVAPYTGAWIEIWL